jgi:Fe-S cluster biosynthesis and repair protein YggX
VRKIFPVLILLFGLFINCRQINNPIVAEAFHHKLYLSEVIAKIPYTDSKEDSLQFMEQYIEEWVLHQTLLANAKKLLSQEEQDFTKQIDQYKEKLLIDEYLKKICGDSSAFSVFSFEVTDFMNDTKETEVQEYREMVKLNFIKLSNRSKIYNKIKGLFFEETDRVKAISQLELICADSIEYYLNDDHWFYTDFIENELPFSFSNKENTEPNSKFDFVKDGFRYLVLILDKKQQLQTSNFSEEKKMAQIILQQQKRIEYLSNFKDSLVKKAMFKKKIILYPIPF